MSAWSKQAVPLIFIEKAALAILSYNHNATTRRIEARAQKWLQECWNAVNGGKGNPDGHKALRKSYGAGVAILDALNKSMARGLTETESEVTVAMCIIAEDTIDQLPAKHQGRRAWTYLLKVLYDLWKLTDTDESDTRGYERGKHIAATVLEAAQ